MKETFGSIYDTLFGIFNNDFFLVFQHLFENGGYIKLGFSFILIPLVFWLLFYYLWKYPYARIWHWLVWLLISIVTVMGITYGIANAEIFNSNNQALNEAIADESNGYEDYVSSLPLKYAMVNCLLAAITGFIYSLLLKQFSKIQIHLPF
jgi:beta-lactamase regulating signal transducer with metallopeptidase domain